MSPNLSHASHAVEPYRCPRCNNFSLSALPRTRFHRLISMVTRVKHFECEMCSWHGIVRASRREDPVLATNVASRANGADKEIGYPADGKMAQKP